MEFGRLGCHVALLLRRSAGPGRQRAGAAHRDRLHRDGRRVYAASCDVRDRAAVDRFVSDVKGRFGTVHFLVNNAGIAIDGALWRLTEDAWPEVLDTNVTGAFNCIRAVAPIFRASTTARSSASAPTRPTGPGSGWPTTPPARRRCWA